MNTLKNTLSFLILLLFGKFLSSLFFVDVVLIRNSSTKFKPALPSRKLLFHYLTVNASILLELLLGLIFYLQGEPMLMV
jgi:hypothetical protein